MRVAQVVKDLGREAFNRSADPSRKPASPGPSIGTVGKFPALRGLIQEIISPSLGTLGQVPFGTAVCLPLANWERHR